MQARGRWQVPESTVGSYSLYGFRFASSAMMPGSLIFAALPN